MPPCAQAVFESAVLDLLATMTSACADAASAALSPADPPPMTRTSVKICGRSVERKGMR